MASTVRDPSSFFVHGSVSQYEFVYNLYDEAVKLKAKQKNKNFEEMLKLDKWYQLELPKKIKSRGKDAHLTHEELVKCMRWKLYRGKFSPRFKDLIQMNTPRLCISETKKAFRALFKKEDLASAVQALCNLKGVGPAMASVILTAASPESCGFMADECLMAIPAIETIDYTLKELLNFVEQLKTASNRLNQEGGNGSWSCHKVEQVLWAYIVLSELDKELLSGMPEEAARPNHTAPTENGTSIANQNCNANNNEGNSISEGSSDSSDSVATKGTAEGSVVADSTNGVSFDPENSNASLLSTPGDTNDSIPSDADPGSSQPTSVAPSDDENSQPPIQPAANSRPEQTTANNLTEAPTANSNTDHVDASNNTTDGVKNDDSLNSRGVLEEGSKKDNGIREADMVDGDNSVDAVKTKESTPQPGDAANDKCAAAALLVGGAVNDLKETNGMATALDHGQPHPKKIKLDD